MNFTSKLPEISKNQCKVGRYRSTHAPDCVMEKGEEMKEGKNMLKEMLSKQVNKQQSHSTLIYSPWYAENLPKVLGNMDF